MHATLEHLRGTVGVWTTTHESVLPSQAGAVASGVEADGFSAFWIPEAWGREAMTSAQLLLASSSRLVVATGIASIYARDAMAAMAGARTLTELSAGRFVLGLGVSHRPLVERGRGGAYDPPIAAMTAYLDALDTAAMFSVEHDSVPPVVLAALGPRMLELAATRTDGALSYLVTPAHTSRARAVLGDMGFLAVEQSVVLGEDRAEYLRRAHEHLNIYTGLENYRASWRRLGFGDDDFVRGGSDRLCDALVAHGDASEVRRKVDEHVDAGADHVCIQVLGSTLTEVPTQQWAELAGALTRP
ncbi:MAG TPA: TIGR03620 family F420-dependent LLM class oxidoreductase [Acidimicrobiales bacterium]